jgi:hypothetical protein
MNRTLRSKRWMAGLGTAIVALGCGGAASEGPKSEAREGGARARHHAAATESTAAPAASTSFVSRYPAPFLEPDCASGAGDGYLPNAKEAIATVRRAHFKELQACADAAPDGVAVHGEIRTRFRLDPDGVPRCVEAPSTALHEEVVRCVLSVYRTFRFPVPKNGSVLVTDGIELTRTEDDD